MRNENSRADSTVQSRGNTVRVTHGTVGVADKRILETVASLETLVTGLVLAADVDHRRSQTRESFQVVVEAAGFPWCTRE